MIYVVNRSEVKVVMPSRHGDIFTYNQPGAGHADYDVPPSRYNTMNGSAPGSNNSSREDLLNTTGASCDQSYYDTPPSCKNYQSDLSVYDTPPSHLGLDQFDVAGGSVRTSLMSKYSDETMSMSSGVSCSKSNPSVCDSARSSMDISPMDMYDVPPSSKMYGIRSSKDSGLDMYDSPPKMKSSPSTQDDYDVPRTMEREKHFRNIQIPVSEPSSPGDVLEDYDVPPSRNPFGFNVPNTTAKSDSTDLEEYDVPPKHNQTFPVTGKPPIAGRPKRQKSNSVGNILDDYDTPHNNLPTKTSKDDMYATSASGKRYNPEVSDDENNYDEPDPIKTEETDEESGAKSRTLTRENAIDDIYDSPRNNAPVKSITKEFSGVSISGKLDPNVVYDVPPQVTRDSIMSSRSDSSDSNDAGSSRLSTCSSDSRSLDFSPYPTHDELPLDLDAANDLLIKRQQEVQKAADDFYKLVHGSMRKKESYENKQYEIKEASLKVEHMLGEFVGFAQGTLANSAKLNDRKLINKMSKYLIPLVQAHQQIKVCIKHLDDVNWQISKSNVGESPKKDDLGTIISLTKDLNGDVKKLASFIQSNANLLFKRAKDFPRGSITIEHSTPPGNGKPPAGRKPAIPAKTTQLQGRPLPAPPPKERPLPPTPTDRKSFGFNESDTKRHSGEFTYKNSPSDFKHRTGEISVRRMSIDRNSEADSTYKVEDLLQEYDYVELEDDENKKLSQMKDEERLEVEKLLKTITEVSPAERKTVPDETNADSYSKDMEQTLDEIDDVNIYSDDSCGTLKRGMQLSEEKTTDSDNETGTLKRKTEIEEVAEHGENVEDGSNDSDTLKREPKMEEVCEKEKTEIEKEQERVEVPEHDTEHGKPAPLESEDHQVLSFYSEQLDTHMTLLSNSIEAFFQCIETNQGPKVFISHSKFVVVSAHKLVYIGDSLHKNVKHIHVRNNIIQKANLLCDWLKHTVTSTKTAALQYPSVPAVQDMVNKVTAVSHSARDLKEFVCRVAKQY